MKPQERLSESSRDKIKHELKWSLHTMQLVIEHIQLNGLLTESLRECVVQLSKGAVLLEGLIQEVEINDGPAEF